MNTENAKLKAETTDADLAFTRRALDLAALGVGRVSPNPLVGCVVVSTRGDVVGEGTYIYADVVHAEQIALQQAGEMARGGTAYVSLEPHHHHGRTPPCTEALIESGIRRVVCPIEDPNPVVSGKGFARLREAGVEVVTGILADEAERQNEKFIRWHRDGRSFVHLKLATSLDGRISLNRSMSTALSGEAALGRVHELRHEYDAILIGANTAVSDDPQLTDRSGKPRRRPLVRVVLDNGLRISAESRLVQTASEIPTLVFTCSADEGKLSPLRDRGVEIVQSESGGRKLATVLRELKLRDIQSVLVEGGAEVAGSFCDAGLVDKFTFILAPLIIGGNDAPVSISGVGSASLDRATRLADVTVTRYGEDIEITGYPASGTSDAG